MKQITPITVLVFLLTMAAFMAKIRWGYGFSTGA